VTRLLLISVHILHAACTSVLARTTRAEELQRQLQGKMLGINNQQGQEVGGALAQTAGHEECALPVPRQAEQLHAQQLHAQQPHHETSVQRQPAPAQEMQRKAYEYFSDDDSDDYDDLLFPPVHAPSGWGHGGAPAGDGASKTAIREDVM
jgi:hypothetical protein